MLVSEIADLLGYEVVGTDCEILGISWPNSAKEKEIAVINRKNDLSSTLAKVVLTKPIIVQTKKTLLITFEDIENSFVKICKILIDNGIMVDYSIPTQYVLHDSGYYFGKNCRISSKAIIQPGVMIGDNVTIADDCILEPFVTIGSGTVLEKGVHIGSGSKIGVPSFYHYYVEEKIMNFNGCGIVKIGVGTSIGCNTIIQRGTISDTVIGSNSMIGNVIDVGHDVNIGNNCKITSQTGIAGNSCIKDNVLIYGQVGISNNLVIGNNVVIKGRTIVSKSVDDNEVIYGSFGRKYSDEMKLIAKARHFFKGKDE